MTLTDTSRHITRIRRLAPRCAVRFHRVVVPDSLPLPPPESEFVQPSHGKRSIGPCGFSIEEIRYNVRLSRSKEQAGHYGAKPAPVRDNWKRFFEIL